MISLAYNISHCLSGNHVPELRCVICTGVTLESHCFPQSESSNFFMCIISVVTQATGSVSSGNVSAFYVICSEAREIAGDGIVSTGNEESCPWQHRDFNSNTSFIKSL